GCQKSRARTRPCRGFRSSISRARSRSIAPANRWHPKAPVRLGREIAAKFLRRATAGKQRAREGIAAQSASGNTVAIVPYGAALARLFYRDWLAPGRPVPNIEPNGVRRSVPNSFAIRLDVVLRMQGENPLPCTRAPRVRTV